MKAPTPSAAATAREASLYMFSPPFYWRMGVCAMPDALSFRHPVEQKSRSNKVNLAAANRLLPDAAANTKISLFFRSLARGERLRRGPHNPPIAEKLSEAAERL
jgi:hypothetical protein